MCVSACGCMHGRVCVCACSVIQVYLCWFVGVLIDVEEYKEYISVNLGEGIDM